jgi:hypothetical protein
MGLDWILVDSSVEHYDDQLDTFRGKGIATLSIVPTHIKDLCYGDVEDEMSKEARDKILEFLRKLVESPVLSDFQYADDEDVTEKDMLETKAFLGDAISFLEGCDYEKERIVCWY